MLSTTRPQHPNAALLFHTVNTILSAVSSDMIRFYTGLHGPSQLLLSGNENLKPAQREMEAGEKAWQDSYIFNAS